MSVRNIAKRYAEKQLTGAEALAELKEKDLLGDALMTLLVDHFEQRWEREQSYPTSTGQRTGDPTAACSDGRRALHDAFPMATT